MFSFPQRALGWRTFIDGLKMQKPSVDTCLPYAEQEGEESENEIIARLNPDSGVIENLEILFFSLNVGENCYHCHYQLIPI